MVTRKSLLTRCIRLLAASFMIPFIIGCANGSGATNPDDQFCVGTMPPAALSNKNIEIRLAALYQQILGGEVIADYEENSVQLLKDDILREWVVSEVGCRIAKESFSDENLKSWYLTMRRVAHTSPDKLIQWLRENPRPSAQPSSVQMTPVPAGHCVEQIITVFLGNGRTEIRRVGTWAPSGETIMIPVETVPAYMEYMKCEVDEKNST